jgi:hypothetical protein
MIDEHRNAVAIDDLRPVADAEQIGDRFVFVAAVGLFFIDDGAGVLDHARAFRNRRGGVAAGGVDQGGANDEAHTVLESELGV